MRNRTPRVGMPILVIVLGLVIALLVPQFFPDVANIALVGWAVLAGGVLWMIIEVISANKRHSVGSETVQQVDPNTGAKRTETVQDID